MGKHAGMAGWAQIDRRSERARLAIDVIWFIMQSACAKINLSANWAKL